MNLRAGTTGSPDFESGALPLCQLSTTLLIIKGSWESCNNHLIDVFYNYLDTPQKAGKNYFSPTSFNIYFAERLKRHVSHRHYRLGQPAVAKNCSGPRPAWLNSGSDSTFHRR